MSGTAEEHRLEGLDRLQRQDHDTLIRVETKVDVLITDLKEMKDGTTLTIADHENRIKKLESTNTAVNVEESFKQFQGLLQWQRDFSVRWKFVIAIAGGIGGLVSFIVTILSIVAFFGGKPQ